MSRQHWIFRQEGIDAGLFALSILPFFLTTYLPLGDLPEHLAREVILRDLASSDILQRYYYYMWQPTPDLAVDLFVAGLFRWLPVELSVRLFCVAALALIFYGTRLVNRYVWNHPSSIAYRATPLFLYAGPFQFGFINYWFGIGCAVFGFALYLVSRRSAPASRYLLPYAISVVIFFCHLVSWGIYAMAVGAWELSEGLAAYQGRASIKTVLRGVVVREAKAACHICPPLLMLGLGSGIEAHLGRESTLQQKFDGVAALTVFASPRLELLLLGLAVVGFTFALRLDMIRLHRAIWPTLAVGAAIYLVAPRDAGGSSFFDYRIPSAFIFFAIGYTNVRMQGGRARAIGLGFLALIAARIAIISALWFTWEPDLAQIVRAFSILPEGTTMTVVAGSTVSTTARRSPPLDHVAAYAVAARHVFEPFLFADVAGQILHYQSRYRVLRSTAPYPPEAITELDPVYDYLLVVRPYLVAIPTRLPLRLIAEGQDFRLYQIEHAPGDGFYKR